MPLWNTWAFWDSHVPLAYRQTHTFHRKTLLTVKNSGYFKMLKYDRVHTVDIICTHPNIQKNHKTLGILQNDVIRVSAWLVRICVFHVYGRNRVWMKNHTYFYAWTGTPCYFPDAPKLEVVGYIYSVLLCWLKPWPHQIKIVRQYSQHLHSQRFHLQWTTNEWSLLICASNKKIVKVANNLLQTWMLYRGERGDFRTVSHKEMTRI